MPRARVKTESRKRTAVGRQVEKTETTPLHLLLSSSWSTSAIGIPTQLREFEQRDITAIAMDDCDDDPKGRDWRAEAPSRAAAARHEKRGEPSTTCQTLPASHNVRQSFAVTYPLTFFILGAFGLRKRLG